MARRPMSAETKRKIAEALKRYYANKKKGEGTPDKESPRSSSSKRKNVRRKTKAKPRKPQRHIKRMTMGDVINYRKKQAKARKVRAFRSRTRRR